MNRTTLFRSLSLAFASVTLASASFAGSFEQDQQLAMVRGMAQADALVAQNLQAWLSERDVALLAQTDGLITNDMRTDAEQHAIALLVEADGLVTAQLHQVVETLVVARIAAADGLVVTVAELAPSAEAAPAQRAVLVVASR